LDPSEGAFDARSVTEILPMTPVIVVALAGSVNQEFDTGLVRSAEMTEE
jgi:hypothetical protein